MLQVVVEVTLIVIAFVPDVEAVTALLIEEVVSAVAFAVRPIILLPNTKAVTQSLLEVAFVMAAILPEVLTVAIRQAVYVQPGVAIAVGELLHALAVLQPVAELTLVEVT